MIEKISSYLNDGTLFIYGGLLLLFVRLWQHLTKILTKFFSWCAKVFVKAVSREIEEMAKAWLKPFFEEMRKEFDDKINELKKDLNAYKEEKHSIDGELKQLKSAINDEEISRDELKEFVRISKH